MDPSQPPASRWIGWMGWLMDWPMAWVGRVRLMLAGMRESRSDFRSNRLELR